MNFLKLDIKGAELTVSEDVADLLKYADRVFVEYHSFIGQPQKLASLICLLENANFRLNVTPGISSTAPFVRIRQYSGLDLTLNIFGIREARDICN